MLKGNSKEGFFPIRIVTTNKQKIEITYFRFIFIHCQSDLDPQIYRYIYYEVIFKM